MKKTLSVLCSALFAAGAAACIAGCSGSATSGATPVPTPTPTGAFAPVDQAARGTTLLSLAAVKTIDYYARFLRPGLFPANVKPHPVPTCDPKTATATTITPDVTGRNVTIALAFYPAGDTACAESVTSTIELYYPDVAPPSAANPQVGSGYCIRFNPQGEAVEYDAVALVQYTNAPLNVDAEVARYDPTSVPPGFVRPKPGTFPATFPIDFPPPQPLPRPVQPLPFVADRYASIGSGAGTATIGSASTVTTNPSFLPNPGSGPSQFIGTVDSAAVTVSGPDSRGDFTYAAKHSGAAYAYNLQGPVAFTTPTFLLGAGNTTWSFAPIGSGFVAYNFAGGVSDAGTYGPGGTIVGDAQAYTDGVNAAEVRIAFPQPGFTYAVNPIDLLRRASATTPGPFRLGAFGSSRPYTYVFDGTGGDVLDFTVIE